MITNDNEFRSALQGLSISQQRLVAAEMLGHVLPLANDARLDKLQILAATTDPSTDDQTAAYRSAKSISVETHTRCGAEGDWTAQAGYFVARAATSLFATEKKAGTQGIAWPVAMNTRMARTSSSIDAESDQAVDERQAQYLILDKYLDKVDSNE